MSISLSATSLAVSVIVVLYFAIRLGTKRPKLLPYPPGPKGHRLIGNLLDMPAEKEYLAFTNWGRKYGPVSHAEVLGQHIIVLNSYDAVFDLFEKRSLNYSGRRVSKMLNDLMGWGWMTVLLQYGERWQTHRTLMNKYLQPSALKNYKLQEIGVTYGLLGNLLRSPKDFMSHVRNAAVGVILLLVYGHEVTSDNDTLVSSADEAMHWLSKGTAPGAYWVDFMPWLQYVPDWFPGTQWKFDGKIANRLVSGMLYNPFRMTKDRITKGLGAACMMSDMLEEHNHKNTDQERKQEVNEQLIAECLATLYAGGADTTVSILQSAILAFVLHPEIVDRAHAEIDKVVEGQRLPTFEDREALPYLEGIIREAMRWNLALPLGVPRRSDSEDTYNDQRIPAKSVIIANLWAIMHDETRYSDPFTFKPERWLDADGQLLCDSDAPLHPNKVIFGVGRRICPGRHLVEDILYIMLANILSVFDIAKARDKDGRLITPPGTYNSSIINDPDPFECSITPRSAIAEGLIRQALESLT